MNWYGAMKAEGLAADGANEMEQFIRHGVPRTEKEVQLWLADPLTTLLPGEA